MSKVPDRDVKHLDRRDTSLIYSAAMSEPVCIIGASGALGFGLALRLGQAGVGIAIGSRDAERAAETVARAQAAAPAGAFSGFENAEAVTHAETVILSVPFRNQSETLT